MKKTILSNNLGSLVTQRQGDEIVTEQFDGLNRPIAGTRRTHKNAASALAYHRDQIRAIEHMDNGDDPARKDIWWYEMVHSHPDGILLGVRRVRPSKRGVPEGGFGEQSKRFEILTENCVVMQPSRQSTIIRASLQQPRHVFITRWPFNPIYCQ